MYRISFNGIQCTNYVSYWRYGVIIINNYKITLFYIILLEINLVNTEFAIIGLPFSFKRKDLHRHTRQSEYSLNPMTGSANFFRCAVGIHA